MFLNGQLFLVRSFYLSCPKPQKRPFLPFLPDQFGLTVSGTPEVIKNFYEKILSSPGTTGQNLNLIREIVHDDYEMRPNDLNPIMGSGPYAGGLKVMMRMMNTMLPGLYYKPIKTIFCR